MPDSRNVNSSNHHFFDCESKEEEKKCLCDLRRYWKVANIALWVFGFQIVGSLISGSLALLADTIHVGFHFLEYLLIVGMEYWIVKRSLSDRSEKKLRLASGIFGALFLIVMAGFIIWEAFDRFRFPPQIIGWLMMIFAIIGGVANWWQHRILSHSESQHTTQDWAEKHIWSDFLQSVSVVIGGIFVFIGYPIVDPIISILVGLKIIHSAFQLFTKVFKPE